MTVHIVVGLGYGDEGKGSIVDFLVRDSGAHTVVRFNGGSQAAHNVVSPAGVHHCFSQFGSGTLVPEVRTFLSQHMLVDPLALEVEGAVLQGKGIADPLSRLTLHRDCTVITPFHQIANRMVEISRDDNRHGSCGKGIGQAVMDRSFLGNRMLSAGDLLDRDVMRQKLDFLWRLKRDLAEQLAGADHPPQPSQVDYLHRLARPDYVDCLVEEYHSFARHSGVVLADGDHLRQVLTRPDHVVLEGAQGVLLDAIRGFWPYVSPTCTTFHNAQRLLADAGYCGRTLRLGVLRPYSTRHGAGPFVTEDPDLSESLADPNNGTGEWQGAFRIGWFDRVVARYALRVVGQIDGLAVTNLDRISRLERYQTCTAYEIAAREHDHDLLDRFFTWQAGSGERKVIQRIRAPRQTSREHQSQLSGLLGRCRPIYVPTPELSLQFFERELGVPVVIVSEGPTALDKTKPQQLSTSGAPLGRGRRRFPGSLR